MTVIVKTKLSLFQNKKVQNKLKTTRQTVCVCVCGRVIYEPVGENRIIIYKQNH